ncbi:acyl-CoA dehydrogenase family protein [Actinomadura madurae]|uniref:acyl-CoA dehydrogenase family protein n=1 Tax=Actinomadura madurae TaxID=1993 RepID=UPI0020D234E6|nr:acyl-CoA dehydrogenase family protein [Actinomadura madurae]MCP9977561.1 hypothetical protein [Actinomadura madurae]
MADVPAATVTVVPGHDLAGQPRDDVQVDLAALRGVPVAEPVRREYLLRGALARAVQSTGALEQAVELSISHTSQRHQFGRPIAKFQAVQQLVADAACESALARAATDAAVAALVRGTDTLDELELRIAIARSVTGHAISVVVRNAHQVHGAIGTTLEHPLHEVTLPALAWRAEFGSLDHWDQRLTDLLIGAGGPCLAAGGPPALARLIQHGHQVIGIVERPEQVVEQQMPAPQARSRREIGHREGSEVPRRQPRADPRIGTGHDAFPGVQYSARRAIVNKRALRPVRHSPAVPLGATRIFKASPVPCSRRAAATSSSGTIVVMSESRSRRPSTFRARRAVWDVV